MNLTYFAHEGPHTHPHNLPVILAVTLIAVILIWLGIKHLSVQSTGSEDKIKADK